MTYQRNVLASFETREQATLAAQRLAESGVHDVQILPRDETDGRFIVSAMIEDRNARRAEHIIGQHGRFDIGGAHRRSFAASSAPLQEREWRADYRPYVQSARWQTQEWRRPQRSMMPEASTGTLLGALTAIGAGLAFWYGMRQWAEQGERDQRRERNWARSAYRSMDRRGITDEAGTGRERLRKWRENGAMEGLEAAHTSQAIHERNRASHSYASQGLAPNQDRSAAAARDAGDRGTMQTGIGSGSAMTAGLGEEPRRSTAGAGSALGAGADRRSERAGV